MKKVISLLAVVMMLFTVAIGAVATETTGGDINSEEERVMEFLRKDRTVSGIILVFKQEDLNSAENFFRLPNVNMTAAQADYMIAEITKGMNLYVANSKNGTIMDMNELPYDVKKEMLDCAKRAVGQLGFTCEFYVDPVTGQRLLQVYKDGVGVYLNTQVTIDTKGPDKGNNGGNNGGNTGGNTGGPIKQTGTDYTSTIVFSGILFAGLAAAVVFFSRKNKKSLTVA